MEKYILIGYKVDEETNDIYDLDILETSQEKIIVNDDIKSFYNSYDVLTVYKKD